MRNTLAMVLALAVWMLAGAGPVEAAPKKTRVLFVGGDWKAQLPNFGGKTPLRGFFVRQEVERAAPGRFDFTLWTSYEFLQYGNSESLRKFDVIVVGDVMGQSVLPRLVKGLTDFVEGGGGLMYCDNHKAFSFNTVELSFDDFLPIKVVPYRPYNPEKCQPVCSEAPLKVKVTAPGHPIVKGLDWGSAPPLRAARYGELKAGAQVIASSPAGKPIWVVREVGKGRSFWSGGVFSNDELSEDFARWPEFGRFYAQALAWLGEHAAYPEAHLAPATAEGTLTVDLAKRGPTVTPALFGIHGQENAPGGNQPMLGADLALYQALKLDDSFARTSAPSPGGFVKTGPGGQYDYLNDGTDVTVYDPSKYDFQRMDTVLADLDRIHTRPIFLAWCPWWGPNWPEPKRYAKYFAVALQHVNGVPGSKEYRPRVQYFEVLNEPNLGPVETTLPRYADFFNVAASTLHKRFPGVKVGCGGFFEWGYFQEIIDRCGKNLDWFSRHPYGQTGEAIFALQDKYQEYARSKGVNDLKFIITEWDFWIYGTPAFDYLMQRWKPVVDHADSCVGTLQYRWREYNEGGYDFGLHGEIDGAYGELPPEWPNPGKDKPITYRYNAFWIMRDCRGAQATAHLDVPDLRPSPSQHAYAIATSNGKQYNIVVYYGYPYESLSKGKTYEKLHLHIQAPVPPEIKGRSLTISRADSKDRREETTRSLSGDKIDLTLEVPAQSAVSLTVH